MIQKSSKGLFDLTRNNETFDELFLEYSKPLFYYASKFVEKEVARDIVQDIFEKLWSDQKITIRQSLNAFLFTMARNACLQHIEKQKVSNKYLVSSKLSLQEEEIQYYMDERASLIELEMEEKLKKVLDHLPDRCRQVFVMSRFENKRNKQIAEELNISIKAVEKQITKALSIIRAEMKDYLPLLMFMSSHLFRN